MAPIIFTLLPAVILLLLTFAVTFPAFWLNKLKRRNKRNPLTSDMLRSPGETLRKQIDEITEEIDLSLTSSILLPVLIYAVWISQVHFGLVQNNLFTAAIYIGMGVILMGYQAVKLTKLLGRRHDLRLGLDCEQVVGQELNQLMLSGYRVYNDFPAENFNIDHIVIGANGVFAIETKGRAKPADKGDKKNWSVIYDGEVLQFPNWTERNYLSQARRQAVWLSKWISSAIGESVTVQPALAITGWMIEQRKPCDVILFSGKNPVFFSKIKTPKALSPELIQRIVHQVEQRCRDVEPRAYPKE